MIYDVINYIGWKLFDRYADLYIFLMRRIHSANDIFDKLDRLNQKWLGQFPQGPRTLNRFHFEPEIFALSRLIRRVEKRGLKPEFHVHLNDCEHLDRIVETHQPALIVTVHHPVDAVVNRALEDREISWTLLAATHSAEHKAHMLGAKGAIDIVTRSPDTLLTLRRKCHEGRWILADIDFRTPTGELALSPALFEFAIRLNLPVLFFAIRDCHQRTIQMSFELGREAGSPLTSDELALRFMHWLNAIGDKRTWRIEAWRRY